jgi:hypothetical protein
MSSAHDIVPVAAYNQDSSYISDEKDEKYGGGDVRLLSLYGGMTDEIR